MKSAILSLALAAGASFGAWAAEGVVDYTYAEGDLFGYGNKKRETVDVAMMIDDPGLTGLTLKGFRAYIASPEDISGCSLWMTRELTLDKQVNVPDIASFEVSPTAATVAGKKLGLLSVELAEPYVFDGQPVYLGYTITVDALTGDAQNKPVILSKGDHEGGFWIHTNKTLLKWFDYTVTGGGVAYIVASVEGNFAEDVLNISGWQPIFATEGEDFTATFNVANNGSNPVSSVKYSYSFDDTDAIYEGEAALNTPLMPEMGATMPLTLSFRGISGYGPHELHLNIREVNGGPNQGTRPEITAVVNVIPFVPVHRPLVEEYTGLTCGWCPRGYLAMEKVHEDYADSAVAICYHDGDQMAVTKNFAMDVKALPNASIDRRELIDPYYGTFEADNVQYGILLDIDEAIDLPVIASVDISATLEGDILRAGSSVRFIQDIEEADYEIGYVLICNGLYSPVWFQLNYYSGKQGYKGTPLEVLTTWNENQGGLTFNDVAVDVSAMKGVEGSLPASIETNREYTHSWKFDIAGNKLVQNRDNLVVAAFVVDKSTGRVVNSNKSHGVTLGVEGIGADSQAHDDVWYDLTGRRVAKPSKGIYIRNGHKEIVR